MTTTKAPSNKSKTVSFRGLNSQLQLTLTQLLEQLIQSEDEKWQVVNQMPADVVFIDPEVFPTSTATKEVTQASRVIYISQKRKAQGGDPHLSCPIKARDFINCFQSND